MSTAALFEPPVAAPVIDQACPFPGRWSLVCSFFAAGTPGPAGSKSGFALKRRDGSLVTRANGNPVVVMKDSGGEKTKNWRAVVAHEARIAWPHDPVSGPIGLAIDFVIARPQSHFRSNGSLKPNAPSYRGQSPDMSKVLRSTEDALSKILFVDDALIVCEHLTKPYGMRPGAQIALWRLEGM